ncbi:MAG TPA: glycosyltransferase family 2 protein [Polyangiaceae bacterium]|nr:glycosyltransferase family 2 protein [Polyangiaceae bacterium]
MIRAVGVVIPVHDEEVLLAACLETVATACRTLPADVESRIVVVLDACSDGSASIAERFADAGVVTVVVDYENVGRVRRAGVAHVLQHFAGVCLEEVWIATTDADSVVPPGWLREHLAVAETGADAVAGTIRVDDWGTYPAARARAFDEFYTAETDGDEHGHIHGANLGVRADAYVAARGFCALETGEDHSLFRELRRAGKKVVSTRRLWVATSARTTGRAPHGFSEFLRDFAQGNEAP